MLKKKSLPLFVLLTAGIYVFVIPPEPVPLKVVFKLIPMMLILLYAFRQLPPKPAPPMRLIIIGLFFCMLGDAFIAFSFVAGLGAFLVGHVFYLTGFIKMSSLNKVRLYAVFPIAFYSFIIGRQLIAALLRGGEDGLVIPVVAYMLVISVMALTAILTGNGWATAGSLLFVLSDSILSWNRFVSDIPFSDVLIMTTYYSAQLLIATSLSSIGKLEMEEIKERIV